MKNKYTNCILEDGTTIRVELANTFFKRFKGFMFRKLVPGDALLITPCNEIHCFNMKSAIDVIYMDKDDTVLKIDKSMSPWSIGKFVKNGDKVLELYAGDCSRYNINKNDILKFDMGGNTNE